MKIIISIDLDTDNPDDMDTFEELKGFVRNLGEVYDTRSEGEEESS